MRNRTFGTPDMETRRLILSACLAKYSPGNAEVGRRVLRSYLVDSWGQPAVEIDRIFSAAEKVAARKGA